MDFITLRATAQAQLDPVAWSYYQGTADGDPEADQIAWQQIALVPRVMQGLATIDQSLTLGGAHLKTPIMVAATAGHGLANDDGEVATARAAASVGALMVYSSSATVDVTTFGAAAPGPWWAQVYLMRDRRLSDRYVAQAVAAGASALVLTVDLAGSVANAPFRTETQPRMSARPGNFPGLVWEQMSSQIDSDLRPEHIAELAAASGLPVHVKGILHPDDARIAVDAGAAGVIVSNHGRRQASGVVSTAAVLADVVEAVAGRVPVLVDGGVRTGADVLRAIALGATAVGVGRPVLWGLGAAGEPGVTSVLSRLIAEFRQTMAACGAGRLDRIDSTMVRIPR
ncbi:4-hydroxymandelate oxidase [Nakamurella panacisegetis]|uniref:4-hydroxymandelate oxidase n=1 Tax=Nakamurella panacisegetis TaxID=1090615 RepID=A0A1H0JCI7_9ACTN|nr:alpha-hydroxy acid oxidase [Nakamurella panacisegetis]SDO41179.1 4-hydroxymandelate oxidase [Nakamurella panacisegetis]